MMIFMIVVHVVACLTLISVILLQAGRGHGLAGSSFGAEMNTVFGAHSAKVMTKITTTCAILFLVTCLGIDFMIARSGRSMMDDADQNPAVTQAQLEEVMKKLEEAKTAETVTADVVAVASDAVDVAETVKGRVE